jgi:hypothetical protein
VRISLSGKNVKEYIEFIELETKRMEIKTTNPVSFLNILINPLLMKNIKCIYDDFITFQI